MTDSNHFLLAVGIFLFVIVFVNVTLSRLFKVKQRSLFKENYVNATHKKVNFIVTFLLIVVGVLSWAYVLTYTKLEFTVYLILLVVVGAQNAVRTWFEWRHAEEPRQALITVIETLTILLYYGYVSHYIFT
ncbi:uncharacterized protein DUF4181 [Streptohalobacillus salinus]|uniref:Uncharacterized protein DUF4181 n=1 Tax=Streptohalobacillus salinus TaxID=621096 RepID=A0A2V3WFU0_9BACI|nr:DUF4181 domain-containing protein [Streptohalobacillus salinus]PXW92110.1 uncharacterized protein DUF4181 [Streptohalobacillus salinus]